MKYLSTVAMKSRCSRRKTSWACALTIVLIFGLTAACNTTKATVDTTVNFSSSTSPQSLFTQDGQVAKDQQLILYTAVAWESIQQDIARGHGEYVTSLGVLLNTPAQEQTAASAHWQDRYDSLFPDEARGARESIALLRTGLSSSDRAAPARPISAQ